MEKSWKLLKNLNPEITKNLAQELNVSNIIAELLVKRNITNYLEAKLFFRPRIEDLLDPFLMKGMSSAVNKIIETIESNKKIISYHVFYRHQQASLRDLFHKVCYLQCCSQMHWNQTLKIHHGVC